MMFFSLVMKTFGTNGGTERNAYGFAKWLVNQGHRVVVYCGTAKASVDKVEIIRKPVRARGRILKLMAWQRWVQSLPTIKKNEHRLYFIRGGLGGIYRAGGGSHAEWMRINGWRFSDSIERRQDQQTCSKAEKIIVNSTLAGDSIVSDYAIKSSKVRLCRNAIDVNRFRPLDVPRSDKPLAVFVGNGFVRKGLKTALEALVHAKEFELLVIGNDSLRPRFQRYSRKIGVDMRVSFLGHQPNPENHIRKAHVLVLPTHYDPSANVCLEALACGVPFITSGFNGASEISPFDWMVQPNKPMAIADSMLYALHAKEVGDKCREIALSYRPELAFKRLQQCLISP